MTTASRRYMGLIASLGCVVCKRFEATGEPVEVHHIAEGSGLRDDYAVSPLCVAHHRGPAGLHGMGTKAFVRLYRPPLDHEFGLMVWTAQDLEAALWARGMKIGRAA